MLMIDTGAVGTIAIGVIVVIVVLMLVMAKITTSITKKVIGLVVLAALGIVVWTQRVSLQDCADDVRAAAEQDGADARATCTVLGFDIDVDLPDR